MAPITHLSRDLVLPALSKLDDLLSRSAEPTRTLLSVLAPRQDASGPTVTVISGTITPNSDEKPTDAKTLSGGAIAGIVIGSIAGFLLLVWIFRSCSNLGAPPNAEPNPGGNAWYDGIGRRRPPPPPEPLPRSRSRSRHSHRRHSNSGHHHHREYRQHSRGRRPSAEMREVPVAVVRRSSRDHRSRSRNSRY